MLSRPTSLEKEIFDDRARNYKHAREDIISKIESVANGSYPKEKLDELSLDELGELYVSLTRIEFYPAFVEALAIIDVIIGHTHSVPSPDDDYRREQELINFSGRKELGRFGDVFYTLKKYRDPKTMMTEKFFSSEDQVWEQLGVAEIERKHGIGRHELYRVTWPAKFDANRGCYYFSK